MNTAAGTTPTERHRVTVRVPYDAADVEKAAESMDVPVSDEEVNAILDDVGGGLNALASAAVRSAVLSRIYEDVRTVSRGHLASDDD